MAYDLYPAVDETYSFPQVVRQALSESMELRNSVTPMTTTERNNLLALEKWDGRLIANLTTDRLERYDEGLAQWRAIADMAEVTALVDSKLTQRCEFGRNLEYSAVANVQANIPLDRTIYNDATSFTLVSGRIRCERAGRVLASSVVQTYHADAVVRDVRTGFGFNATWHIGAGVTTKDECFLTTTKTFSVVVGDLLSPYIYPFDAASTAGFKVGAFGWFALDYI